MVNGEVKTHQCQICNGTFSKKENLKTHVSRIHDKNKLFNCDYCNKSFEVKKNLK